MPYSPLKVTRRFGRTYHLHLQSRRISQARNQQEAGSKQSSGIIFGPEDGVRLQVVHLSLLPVSCWFLSWLIFRPWRWRRYVSPKRWLTFNELHDTICNKISLFITTSMRTHIHVRISVMGQTCSWDEKNENDRQKFGLWSVLEHCKECEADEM
jgi:hypothetical protein